MNIKKFIAYLLVYAVVISSVPLFFNNMWLKDLPEIKTYDGALDFSASRAYEDIKYITSNFPERSVGSQNAEASSNWILQEFENIGLDSRIEEFTCRSPMKLINATMGEITDDTADEQPEPSIDFNRFSMNGVFEKVKGINVIGVSKGKSDETIILGAHRDTYGTLEGAQDNASGTASMLELARVLTDEEHYYTYMFISFDGEEIGLTGSEAFAQRHSLKDVKFAMILDCVGYKDANTAGLYQYAGSKGASPLWTTALANDLIKKSGRSEYYIDDEGGFSSSSLSVFTPLLTKMVSQRVSGDVNTDSGPFVDRNIPSVGFIAANSNKTVDSENVFHTKNDTILNISEGTLDFIGKLSEQYIKSVELNDFPPELKSNLYIIQDNKYLDFRFILAFIVLLMIACIALWFISSEDAIKNPKIFAGFLKNELPWIISTAALSAFSGFIWQIFRFDFAADLNIIILILLWILVNFVGLITIIVMRFISLRGKKDKYYEITKYQRILLNSLYTIVFIAISIYLNVFVAMILVGTPLLLMGRVGYKNVASRVIWIIMLLVWFIIQTTLLMTCIESHVFDILSMKSAAILFAYSLLVTFTFVYVISSPGMPRKTKDREIITVES